MKVSTRSNANVSRAILTQTLRTMSIQRTTAEKREIVKRYMDEVYGEKNLAVIDELVAEDYVDHMKGFEGR